MQRKIGQDNAVLILAPVFFTPQNDTGFMVAYSSGIACVQAGDSGAPYDNVHRICELTRAAATHEGVLHGRILRKDQNN